MKLLLWGSSLFVFAFLFHFVVWKVHLPGRQTKALLSIFLGTLVVVPISLVLITEFSPELKPWMPTGISEWMRIGIFHVALTLSYMITYSAIETDSPSLVMVMAIANAGPGGIDEKDFEATLNDDLLIKPRIKDLLTDKMVYMKNDTYRLTKKGMLFANIFIYYRAVLRAPKGG